MKTITKLAFLFFLAIALQAADSRTTIKISQTGIPSDGNVLTVNGSTRTWKTSVSTPNTQILIGGTIAESANNLATHLTTYGFSGTSTLQNSLINYIFGGVNQVVTVSSSGAWATITSQTDPYVQRPLMLPLSAMSAGVRPGLANDLIDAFQYATIVFASSAPALANFVDISEAQTIDGVKTFRGGNVYSNANQIHTLGLVSNVVARAAKLKQAASLSGLYFLNSSDAAIYTVAPSSAGRPQIKSLAGDTLATGPTYSPDDDDILTRRIAENYFGRLTLVNTWSANATFTATILPHIISGGRTTNMYLHGATNWFDLTLFRGQTMISNTVPTFEFWDTDALANEQRWSIVANANRFQINTLNDAGTLTGTAIDILRTSGVPQEIDINALLKVNFGAQFEGDVTFEDAIATEGHFTAEGILFSGAIGTTMPTGQTSGIFLQDSVFGPFADPVNGFSIWSEAGVLRYRSSAANEGSGRANFFHRRDLTVQASGSDATLPTATALVDCGGTDPTVTLPTEGIWDIVCQVSYVAQTGTDDVRFKLRNTTTGTDVANSDVWVQCAPGERAAILVKGTVTADPSDVIALWGHNQSGVSRGLVESARTRIWAERRR